MLKCGRVEHDLISLNAVLYANFVNTGSVIICN